MKMMARILESRYGSYPATEVAMTNTPSLRCLFATHRATWV
jgi:hypothetical protein